MAPMLKGSVAQRLLIFFSRASAVARADEQWVTYKDCRYLPNAANDGDSFHVAPQGIHLSALLCRCSGDRHAHSGTAWPNRQTCFHVTIQAALQIGLEAERFTRKKLSRPFTIRTRKQDARGRSRRPRYFAFVQTETGDLGEQLIANGLSRAYGAASGAPGMSTPEANGGNSNNWNAKRRNKGSAARDIGPKK